MAAVDRLEEIRECATAGASGGWSNLRRYLCTANGAEFVDRAVYGEALEDEAGEILADFVDPDYWNRGDAARAELRRRLGRLVDELAAAGAA